MVKAVKALFEQKFADLHNRIIISEGLEETYRKRGQMRLAQFEYQRQMELKKALRDLALQYAELSEIKAEGTI